MKIEKGLRDMRGHKLWENGIATLGDPKGL